MPGWAGANFGYSRGRCGVESRREKFPSCESFEQRRDSGASGSTESDWSKVSAEWGYPSVCTVSIQEKQGISGCGVVRRIVRSAG